MMEMKGHTGRCHGEMNSPACMHSRGQVSTEVLLLIGMMLLLLLPLLVYAFNRADVARDDLTVQKASFAAQRLAKLSDSVGYLGGAAGIVDEIEIPPRVRNITVSGHDIIFDVDSLNGRMQIVKTSAFSIKSDSANLARVTKEGTYWFEVSALDLDDPSGAQVKITVK